MQLLVTGATGFIGRNLVRNLLGKRYDVKILSRNSAPQNIEWLDEVSLIQGDLNDREAVRRATQDTEVVIHLAAQMGSWKVSKEVYLQTNVEGTRMLIEANVKVKHFIYVSSAGVFGNLKYIPADESHPCAPRTLYEQTKYLAEQYVMKYINEGFPATIIRPSHVYGPGDLNILPLLRIINKLHVFPLINGGKALFQPIYIDDLTTGIIACLEHSDSVLGKDYILAGPECVTFRNFIYLLAELLSTKILTITCPYSVAMCGAIINEFGAKASGLSPLLTRSRVDFFGKHQSYNIAKAKHDFQFMPAVTIKNGMKTALEWYQSCGLI